MKTVNPYFLHSLLDPLTGLADDDEAMEEFSEFNSNDTSASRELIRKMIVPHCESMGAAIRERVQLAYRYYLSVDSSDFERVFESVLPPFDPPENPRDFFVWIWEECFPQEPYQLFDVADYVVDADINEPSKIAKPPA